MRTVFSWSWEEGVQESTFVSSWGAFTFCQFYVEATEWSILVLIWNMKSHYLRPKHGVVTSLNEKGYCPQQVVFHFVNRTLPVYNVNRTLPVYNVNHLLPVYNVNCPLPVYNVNRTLVNQRFTCNFSMRFRSSTK